MFQMGNMYLLRSPEEMVLISTGPNIAKHGTHGKNLLVLRE